MFDRLFHKLRTKRPPPDPDDPLATRAHLNGLMRMADEIVVRELILVPESSAGSEPGPDEPYTD